MTATTNLHAMAAAPAYQRAMLALVVRQLRTCQGAWIDYGAGHGDYARRLHTAWTPIWCVEPDPAARAAIPAKLQAYSRCGALPGKAAAAYSLNVLEHIEDDAAALGEVARCLKAGGALFVLVPAHPALWTAMDQQVGHLRRYTAKSLRDTARRAGLTVQREGWFDRTGFLATAAWKFWRRCNPRPWRGELTPEQLRRFDVVFNWLEPLLAWLPFGKNRWILLTCP